MKLYIRSRSGSLACHIALHETGMPFTLDEVDTVRKRTADGMDYLQVNKMGYVPTLELDDGTLISEGPAILMYLGMRFPNAGLLPPETDIVGRAHIYSLVNFIAAEIHKSFSPFFTPDLSDADKRRAQQRLDRRLDHMAGIFADGRNFLTGENFTVADAYLLTVLRWMPATNRTIDTWPLLSGFLARAKLRPAVRAAMQAEQISEELTPL